MTGIPPGVGLDRNQIRVRIGSRTGQAYIDLAMTTQPIEISYADGFKDKAVPSATHCTGRLGAFDGQCSLEKQ